MLTENHKIKRFEHAKNLIEADISNYVFSDETYVRLFEDRTLTLSKSGQATKKILSQKLCHLSPPMVYESPINKFY